MACAFVAPLFTNSLRIPDGSSIFTAEAVAVYRALQYIKLSKFEKFIIFTDSLSLIQSIQNLNEKNAVVLSIFEILGQIFEKKKKVIFCWIPSHVGIKGNELADQAAKQALDLQISPIPVPFVDKIPYVKTSLSNSWQQDWNMTIDNK